MASEQVRIVGHVRLDVELGRARGEHIGRVADAVPHRRNRHDAGRELLVPLILRHLAAERVEYPAIVLEQVFHAALGGAAHLAVVHPELPFRRRHQHFRVWESELVALVDQAIHVIAVEMRDDHRVDVGHLDAGGGEVLRQLAELALGLLEGARAAAGVEQDELRAGVDHDRRVVMDHLVGRQIDRLQRLAHLRDRRIGDVALRQREHARAIGEHRDLVRSDLVAIDAGRLLAGWRRCCLRRCASPRNLRRRRFPRTLNGVSIRLSFPPAIAVYGAGCALQTINTI